MYIYIKDLQESKYNEILIYICIYVYMYIFICIYKRFARIEI